jgi:hypothetical protein
MLMIGNDMSYKLVAFLSTNMLFLEHNFCGRFVETD